MYAALTARRDHFMLPIGVAPAGVAGDTAYKTHVCRFVKEQIMFAHVLAFSVLAVISPAGRAALAPHQAAPTSLAERIAAIKMAHRELERKFHEDLTTFRADNKKVQDLNDEYHKASHKQAEDLIRLIKAHGKEPAAFEGMLVLVGDLRYPLDDELIQLVLKQHLTHARMGELCFALRYRSSEAWAGNLLETVVAKHGEKVVRGQALYALGIYHRYRAQPYGEKLAEAEAARRLAEAARYFTEVAKSYATVTTPDGKEKLGDKAASELVRIKNLPNLKVGKTAPEIVGEDIDGRKFTLSDYRGKVVVLDFWGHW
jgi:hypothetical protein